MQVLFIGNRLNGRRSRIGCGGCDRCGVGRSRGIGLARMSRSAAFAQQIRLADSTSRVGP